MRINVDLFKSGEGETWTHDKSSALPTELPHEIWVLASGYTYELDTTRIIDLGKTLASYWNNGIFNLFLYVTAFSAVAEKFYISNYRL